MKYRATAGVSGELVDVSPTTPLPVAGTVTAPTVESKLDTLTTDVQGLATQLSTLAGLLGGAALTDASIASATGASQSVIAASATRKVLKVSNPGVSSWWINESGGTAVANGAGCFELPPGARWTPVPCPTNAVTGIGTATAALTVVVG
jgi:hypothetical protein